MRHWMLQDLGVYSNLLASPMTGSSLFALCRCLSPLFEALEDWTFGLLRYDNKHTLQDVVVEHNDYKGISDYTVIGEPRSSAENFNWF